MGSIDRKNGTPQLLNRLRLRQIALMLAVKEQRTLRAAAAQLGMSQPAATKMLHELEDALDVRLFERMGRGLRISEAGERVMDYCQNLRASVEALNRELMELRQGSAGRLAMGSIMAASPGRLTKALLCIKQQSPLLSIEVAVDTSDRLLAQLRDGVLEVVVGRMTGDHCDDYLFRPIDDEELVVVSSLSHPLARKRQTTLEALRPYAWVLQPPGSPMRTLIDQEFRDRGLALPRGLIETGSILTSINLVRSSTMVAVVPAAVARSHAEHGMLRLLPFRFGRRLEAYGSIVRRDHSLSQPAQQFLALLHESTA
ncbi:LysR family transcriptional regulator [Verminephrobacter aporrectodeae]|uniref:LysR family transcriptional regulator n=1 Tax=Verminephrobacter aporrectodeae TaxID=1110389 RepID=UPI0002376514|nr:LysR family transcriptional regulator [Verminephrobacter aporrectodeae]